jgi:NTE family protein
MTENRHKWGLVLGGGAVRGMAHIGVLQVLDEAGLRPDLVVGVSAGSVAGALYSAGLAPDRIYALARDAGWRKLARLVPPRLGVVDISPLGEWVGELTEGAHVEDLPIPFVAVAADIQSGELVPFDRGPVRDAVLASCAVPGIVCPVETNGRLLVDGGVLNDLPVNLARRMGTERVVAVNLLPPPNLPAERPTNLLEMWSLAFYTLTRLTRVEEGREADVHILPDIADASFVDFRQMEALVQKGREAAEAALPAIYEMLE